MATELISPVDVQIELTQTCNYFCRHCYNFWRPSGVSMRNKSLSCVELSHIVGDLVKNQVPSITITGGEPFTRKKELFTLLEMAKKEKIQASINTNLSLVNEKDIEVLVKEYRHVPILFSFLSPEHKEHDYLSGAKPDKFLKVLRTAKIMIDRGMTLSLNMVLMPSNLHSMENMAKLAKGLGVRTFCATKVLPNQKSTDSALILSVEEVHKSLSELIRIEKELGINVDILGCYPKCLLVGTESYKRFSHRTCVAGCTTATIGADGRVRACSHMENSYGNIFDESLSEIWSKMRGWREGVFIPEGCKKCSLSMICRGGCRVNTPTSNLQDLDIYTDMSKACRLKQNESNLVLVHKKKEIGGLFYVPSDVKFREEDFGALMYKVNPLKLILINGAAAKFLKMAMENGHAFDLEMFISQSGAKIEREFCIVKNLFNKLHEKGFVVQLN